MWSIFKFVFLANSLKIASSLSKALDPESDKVASKRFFPSQNGQTTEFCSNYTAKNNCIDETNTQQSLSSPKNYTFPDCRIYLAKSTIKSPFAGMGVFTAIPLKQGQVIAAPDIVLNLHDFPKDMRGALSLLLRDYAWDSQHTGAFYEGKRVVSVLPGIGSLSNTQLFRTHANALPFRLDVDEANVSRTKNPGAGAFSHYHNLTFHATKDLEPGTEIFVHYSSDDVFYQERINVFSNDNNINRSSNERSTSVNFKHSRDTDWLKENGHCLDNLRPGQSTIKMAGRGAFATRFIPKGTLISPAPVIQIPNLHDLNTMKDKPGKGDKPQLILNYCFGNVNSTLLFLPISPVVNFINHGTADQVNAKVQWSSSTQHQGTVWPLDYSLKQVQSLDHTGFMFDYIATKNILPNEEVFIDYGSDWTRAWDGHTGSWKSRAEDESYMPAYVMDDVAGVLRTDKEQQTHPFPKNLITSCFYKYYQDSEDVVTPKDKTEATTMRWKMERETFQFRNLRPCSIIQRDKLPNGQFIYTVMIKNRYGLAQGNRIPKGQIHVVSHVPRQAIRFSDKMYTSDQHLQNSFRHSIGLSDGVFPKRWQDLL